MVRRYYKRRNVNKDKYSVETFMMQTPSTLQGWTAVQQTGQSDTYQFVETVVNSSSIQGMRKVKHITMTFSSNTVSPIAYALVYVPAGYNPTSIRWPIAGNAISIYEPNQFVLSRGVLDFTGGPLRVSTPLSRNLNSGDSIQLIFATTNTEVAPSIITTVKYAITLQ